MKKQFAEITEEDTRAALVELQPQFGSPSEVFSERKGQFLVSGEDRLFISFSAKSKDWREVQLK